MNWRKWLNWFVRKEFVFFYPGITEPLRIEACDMDHARRKLRAYMQEYVSSVPWMKATFKANPELVDKELAKFTGYEVADK